MGHFIPEFGRGSSPEVVPDGDLPAEAGNPSTPGGGLSADLGPYKFPGLFKR
jgi:hypothetical protein